MTLASGNRGKWGASVKSAPLDTGLTLIRTAAGRVSAANDRLNNKFKSWMPTGLYARALLIMIVPMVVLQSVVAFVFMERHWNTVTRRLSAAVTQDIAALIDIDRKSTRLNSSHRSLSRMPSSA